jgi:hypothetical protein
MRGKPTTKTTRKRQLGPMHPACHQRHTTRTSTVIVLMISLFDKEIHVPAADRRSPDQCEIAFLSCVPLARKNAMNDSQAQQPTEPILAAIKPFLNKAISIWNFYWKMAWHPRQFADEYLQVPTAATITKAVKHTFWLAGFWAAMSSFVGSVGGWMGAPNGSFSEFVMIFVTIAMIGLQVIPMAGVLWLLTRRYHTSISQTLLFFISMYNLFLGATLLIYSIVGAVAIPFQLILYLSHSLTETTDFQSFVDWFKASGYWKWYIALLIIMGTSCAFAWCQVFFFAAPAMIAGTIRTSYWHGLWRLFVSILIPLIAIEGLFAWITFAWIFPLLHKSLS